MAHVMAHSKFLRRHGDPCEGARLSGSWFRVTSVEYVIAGLDPAIHGETPAPTSADKRALDAGVYMPNAVDARVKHGHDEIKGVYNQPDCHGQGAAIQGPRP